MKNGDAELERMIERIRAVPGIAKRAAPDAAEAVREALARTAAAGTTPEGQAWAPRKDDGGRPLVGAEQALRAAAVGTRIFIRLEGHVARHHRGIARGGVERRLLPEKGITPAIGKAIREVVTDHFRRTVEGRD
ncbi:MAG TPA: hypothetical protein VD838_13355 [Anaeromyxobacteraceae bacterium]|nr:hypothetical protein [Anaeromyxobacteraceae bacterium]